MTLSLYKFISFIVCIHHSHVVIHIIAGSFEVKRIPRHLWKYFIILEACSDDAHDSLSYDDNFWNKFKTLTKL